MIDLRWTELSKSLSLLFIISYGLYVVYYYGKSVSLASLRKTSSITGIVLFSLYLIVFVSTNSGSDWYSYQDMVWNYDLRPGADNYGEPIYRYIVWIVNRNYFSFRIIVWGGAFLLACLSFKKFGINIKTAVYFFIVVFLVRFNYARASLAAACYFYGLTTLLKPYKNKAINYIIAGVSFVFAYEFHHSILPVLLFTFAVFIPLEKYYIIIPLIIILPFIATFILDRISIIEILANDYVVDKVGRYMERTSEEATTFGMVAEIIMYGGFLVPFILTSFIFFRNRNKKIEKAVMYIYRITITIILFAASFLFMGLLSDAFTYRYLFMTAVPLTILSVYLYQNKLMKKTVFITILAFGIIANIYPLLYGLYKMI